MNGSPPSPFLADQRCSFRIRRRAVAAQGSAPTGDHQQLLDLDAVDVADGEGLGISR